MKQSEAQREHRRASPSPSSVQAEPAYGRGASAGRFEPTDGVEDDVGAFESSWHLWFLIVAATTVAAMVLAVLTFQSA